MNGIMDFFSAALPWIVMGVALAIFFAREGKRKKRRQPDSRQIKINAAGAKTPAAYFCVFPRIS